MTRLVLMMMLGVLLGMLFVALLETNWVFQFQRLGALLNVGSWRKQ